MTAKQKANQARFKKVVAEAKNLRKKNPKLTQAQAVKQAWAIQISKEKRNPIKQAKKKITAYVTNFKEDFYRGYYGDEYKKKRKKVGAMPTKVKAKKGKRTSDMHTDTKSHNVNIRVMSGISSPSSYVFVIRLEKVVKEISQREEVINSVKSRRNELIEKNGKMWYNKFLRDARKIVSNLKKEKTKLKSFI